MFTNPAKVFQLDCHLLSLACSVECFTPVPWSFPFNFSEWRTNLYACVLYIMYVTVFNRQHVEATQVSIFSLFSECNVSFKTFSNVGFPSNACTHWTFASCKSIVHIIFWQTSVLWYLNDVDLKTERLKGDNYLFLSQQVKWLMPMIVLRWGFVFFITDVIPCLRGEQCLVFLYY